MQIDQIIRLKLSGQRALLGEVSCGLISVSIDMIGTEILWRCIYETIDEKEKYWEDLSAAAAEVIADYPAGYKITEEHLAQGSGIYPLKNLIYLRKPTQQSDAPGRDSPTR